MTSLCKAPSPITPYLIPNIPTLDPGRFMATPGQIISLSDVNPSQNDGLDKQTGKKMLNDIVDGIRQGHKLLFRAQTHAMLSGFVGLDGAGKGSAIRKVCASDPAVVEYSTFKAPTEAELKRLFLLRFERGIPQHGRHAVWDRTHYGDHLYPKLFATLGAEELATRLDQIKTLEMWLHGANVLISKFLLVVSKEKQRERLEARKADRIKQFKASQADFDVHKRYDEVMQIFEEMMNATSTPEAPWFLIPADRKWYARLVIASIILSQMYEYQEIWIKAIFERGAQKMLEDFGVTVS